MTRNRYATQGRCLIIALQRKPHTYGEMISLGFGLSPWKRVKEALRGDPSRQVQTGRKRICGEWLTTWRVVRVVAPNGSVEPCTTVRRCDSARTRG